MARFSHKAFTLASLMALTLASPAFLSAATPNERAQERAAEQDGSYHYLKGELDFVAYTSISKGLDAVRAALEELKLVVTNQEMKDALTARVDAHRPGDESKVSVTLKQLPSKENGRERVEIGIHVGALGDKERAKLIKQKIEAKLATPARSVNNR